MTKGYFICAGHVIRNAASIFLSFLFLVLIFSSVSYAGIVTNQNTGSTYETVQAALTAASAGNVLLCNGLFSEYNIAWPNTNNITLKASTESSVCTIDAGAVNGRRCISVANTVNMTLEGFTLQNAYTSGYGAAIYMQAANSKLWLDDVLVQNCTAERGAAVCCPDQDISINIYANNSVFDNNYSTTIAGVGSNGNWTANSCIFRNNRAAAGGLFWSYDANGIYKLTDCTIEDNYASAGSGVSVGVILHAKNCIFNNNSTAGWGGIGESVTMVATNCVFSNNVAAGTYGGGLAYLSLPWKVYNCTFYNNSATTGTGGVAYNAGGTWTSVNCIYSGNHAPSGQVFTAGTSTAITYSDIQADDFHAGTGNISAEPSFVSTDEADPDFLKLLSDSPCIDTGTSEGAPSDDQAGTSRPQPPGGSYDMGAYEYQAPLTEVWVSTNGSDSTGDGSLNNPYATIQKGLNSAEAGWSVNVFGGTYNEYNITWPNTDNVTLKASMESTVCTIDAGTNGRIFSVGNTLNLTIEGFTLQNGRISAHGAGIYLSASNTKLWLEKVTIQNCTTEGSDHFGAAIACVNDTVSIYGNNSAFIRNWVWHVGGVGFYGVWNLTNCLIKDNHCENIGGVNYLGFWNVTGCTIEGNSAVGASGVSHGGPWNARNSVFKGNYAAYGALGENLSLTATNCVFYDNYSFSNSGGLSAALIYNYATINCFLMNCTFYNNFSYNASGGCGVALLYYYSGQPTWTSINCIYSGNTSEAYPLFYLYSANPTITYSDIQSDQFIDGTGNISAEPGFASTVKTDPDFLRLGADSPCVDSATSEGAPSNDLAGNARPFGAGYDMGAYESSGNFLTVIQPNGGESIFAPSTYNIMWESSTAESEVYIRLSTNEGAAWDTELTHEAWTHSGVSTYEWDVPSLVSSQCRISVEALCDSGWLIDASNGNFALNMEITPPLVTVEAPNGGESWEIDSLHNITWTATDEFGIDHVNIYYATNEGSSWTAITTEVANTGTYEDWTSSIPENRYKIRIQAIDTNGNISTDESDANFTFYKKGSYSGCVLWNKLGSNAEVGTSEIGPDGTIGGTVTYESCMFNDGARANSDGHVEFGDLGLRNKGCYDVWIKPLYSNANGSGLDTVFSSYLDTVNRVILFLGYGNPGYIRVYVQSPSGASDKNYSLTWSANEKIHLGLVWDSSAGFDGSKTNALYINGVQVGSDTAAISMSGTMTLNTALAVWYNGSIWADGNSNQTVVDNVKLFDYPKTDYSDRFYEGFGSISEVRVLTPNAAGITLEQGATYEVTWSATDETGISNIYIRYSTGDAYPWIGISTNESNDSSYIWTVPTEESTTCRVSIEATFGSGTKESDSSDNYFEIKAPPAPPADLWVSTTGFDTAEGTVNDPYRTIGYALSQVQAGKTIYSFGGTYNENDISWPNVANITLKASLETTPVTIDAGSAGRVINVANALTLTIEGITMQNGKTAAGNGGGINMTSGVTLFLKNSIIQYCTVESGYLGGALYAQNCAIYADDSKFMGNSATAAGYGGVSQGGSWVANKCVFIGNSAAYGAVNRNSGDPGGWTVTNCVFAYNIAFSGISMTNDGAYWNSYNCVYYGNNSQSGWGAFDNGGGGTTSLINSIFWGNTGLLTSRSMVASGSYSDIQGGLSGTGNIDSDPLFASTEAEDPQFLYLGTDSPCIDTGTSEGAPSDDLAGVSRPQGSGYDMGPYEYIGEEPAGTDYAVTRFYLPSTGAAEVSPSFSAWDNTTGANRVRCVTKQVYSTFATKGTNAAADAGKYLNRQYVSDPIAGQTISGYVSGEVRGSYSGTMSSVSSEVIIKVVSNDGQTLRGTLLDFTFGNTQYGASLKSYWIPQCMAVTPVAAENGDRIVIEIGGLRSSGTSTPTIDHEFGDSASTNEVEGSTVQSNPWIGFSHGIKLPSVTVIGQ